MASSSNWYVYIVRCRDGTLYTGCAVDVAARIIVHNKGLGAKYTKPRLPVTLVYSEPAEDRSCAQKREYAIKQLTLLQKKALIETH